MIDHIAMYVDNLEKIREFYEKYFNAISNKKYVNKNTGLETYFLSFKSGSKLEIMAKPDLLPTEKGLYKKGYVHIAFSVSYSHDVDNLTKKLKDDGYKILSLPRITGDGYYESVVCDPEDNIIEITHYKG